MRKTAYYMIAAAAIAATAASCGNGDVDIESSDCPIALAVGGTRAEINMPEGTFTVAAKRCSGPSWNAGSAVNVFRGTGGLQNVTTDGTGACTYSPVEYWKPSNYYRFRAVSPIAEGLSGYSDDLDGNVSIPLFRVNSSAASQQDLVLSDLVSTAIPSPIGEPAPVALTFRHLLSKVTFQIGENTSAANASVDEFTVTGVKLNGLPDSGAYSGTSTSGTWNTSGASSLTCVNNTNIPLDGDGTFSNVFTGLLLIPMTITNQVNLVLDYKVVHNGGSPATKSVVINIPAITWEAGKAYTYRLSLSEEYFIKFGNITVEPWGDTQASGSVIIK